MPSGGLSALVAPPQFGTEPPPGPPGHVALPGLPPGHRVELPPELANNPEFLTTLLQTLAQAAPAWRPAGGARAYWNGGQRDLNNLRGPEIAPTAPGQDYYRIVPDQAEADAALAEGDNPLIWRWPTAPDFNALQQQQLGQYAAPGGTPLFSADAAGQLYRSGDADTRPWDRGGLAGLLSRGGR